ncbi:MAG: CHAP domain-containing protein [Candidatus Dormibacteraceae bacterium]
MTAGRTADLPLSPRRTLVVVGVATFAVAALLVAHPARAHAAAQCDPGLSACVQLQQAEQQQSTAQQQLDQIEASQASAQQQAEQIAGVVAQAQAAVQAQEDAIARTQAQIEATERQERYTQASIDRDQATLQVRQQVVDEQVRNDAETDQTSYLQVLLTAQNFTEFVNRAMLVSKLIQANQRLVAQVQAERSQVQAQKVVLQKQQQEETTLLNQQVQEEVVLQAQLATQQAALARQQQLVAQIAAQGAAQQQVVNNLQAQIDQDSANYQAQLAAQLEAEKLAAEAQQPPAPAFSGGSSGGGGGGDVGSFNGGNTFPWGQCTYWVAANFNVTWSGNADDWLGNAEAQGYATSGTPQAGSIVVWGSGGGYSEFGHVAIVESVQSSTSFTVSEMNFYGVGITDERYVTSLSDVEGFIL